MVSPTPTITRVLAIDKIRTPQRVGCPAAGVHPGVIVVFLGFLMLAACGLSPTTRSGESGSDSELVSEVGDPSVPPLFVAVGDAVYTSGDGVEWNSQSFSLVNQATVSYGNGRALVVGMGGRLITSEYGSRWNEVGHPVGGLIGTNAVTYGAGGFVAVGEVFADALVAIAATSPDGINWTPRDVTHLPNGLRSVTYGEGKFVAVGHGFSATSPDGTVWTEGSGRFLGQLFDVAYGNGRFVIVGGRGSVFSSTDGVTWEEGVSVLSNVFFLRGVTYGDGRFVAVGDEYVVRGEFVPGEGYGSERPFNRSAIVSSQNGVSWDIHYTGPSQALSDVAYGDGMFVAIGDNEGPRDEWGNATSYNAVVLTSNNGTDWTVTEVGGPSVLNQEAGSFESSLDNPRVWLSSVTYWPSSDGS